MKSTHSNAPVFNKEQVVSCIAKFNWPLTHCKLMMEMYVGIFV